MKNYLRNHCSRYRKQNNQEKKTQSRARVKSLPQVKQPVSRRKSPAKKVDLPKKSCDEKQLVVAQSPQVLLPKLDAASEKNVPSSERIVTVCNKITKDMTTYKRHWTGSYTPSKFILSVNDQEVKQGSHEKIKIKDNTLKVRYDFVFSVGGVPYRSGGKVVEFKVPDDVEAIEPTFSWMLRHITLHLRKLNTSLRMMLAKRY